MNFTLVVVMVLNHLFIHHMLALLSYYRSELKLKFDCQLESIVFLFISFFSSVKDEHSCTLFVVP